MLRLLLAALATAWCSAAFAQSNFPAPGNQNVPGSVGMCINGSNQAVPCSGSTPFQVANPSPAAGTPAAGYPPGATAITGNAVGTTAAVVGTLAAASGKFTYICGFTISTIGGTATSGPVTVAGLIGTSMVFQLPVNATAGQIFPTQNFFPCVQASAVNTAITVTTTAAVGATAVDVNSWGFQQ
jgi:hypothetical protein